MKKSRIMMSMFVIALAAALIGGATIAYFSYKVTVEDNVFTAGTVEITAGDSNDYTMNLDNVNPGDCRDKWIKICNTGSKNVKLRMKADMIAITFAEGYIEDNWDELCFSDLGNFTEQKLENLLDAAREAEIVEISVEGWTLEDDGYYYRTAALAPGDDDNPSCINVKVKVCFDGPGMGNIYQGAEFSVSVIVEALQASNDATWPTAD